jgi:hypothetical protein
VALYLAGQAGEVCLVKASQLAEMLGQLAQPPQLVYLSSCELAHPRMIWSEFCPLADLSI